MKSASVMRTGVSRVYSVPLTVTVMVRLSVMGRSWHGLSRVSFDHLVGGSEELRREFDAQHSGGFDIDDEFKLARLDHRQIGGLLALENPPNIERRLAIGL